MFPKSEKKNTEQISSLSGTQKLQYFWDYYKLHLITVLVLLGSLCSFLHHRLTQKETVLYLGFANVVIGDDSSKKFGDDFLSTNHQNPSKKQVYFYKDLSLTDEANSINQEYAYVSRMKLLASIEARQLDIVLMNQEAFDAFSQSGYLDDMDKLLQTKLPKLYPDLKDTLSLNTTSSGEDAADDSSKVETYAMAINLDTSPLIKKLGFPDTVYLGVLKNSPRKETAAAYIQYLFK
ncbi:MAG: hypothetical protein IJ733_13730 [Lachnospiraceae bacterium]|nr:hypothetical protein [Lachnospiraceae bacterium]